MLISTRLPCLRAVFLSQHSPEAVTFLVKHGAKLTQLGLADKMYTREVFDAVPNLTTLTVNEASAHNSLSSSMFSLYVLTAVCATMPRRSNAFERVVNQSGLGIVRAVFLASRLLVLTCLPGTERASTRYWPSI